MSLNCTIFELCAEDIVQSDTVVYVPPLVRLVISAVGTVTFVNGRGETVSFIVPAVAAGGSLPFVLDGQITQILDTGTTIADADLTGFRKASETPTTAD